MINYKNSPWLQTGTTALIAFSTYLFFYPLRRAYTAASFTDLIYFGVQFKILIITAQVLGFAVSKGFGIKIVSEILPEKRAISLFYISIISWLCMLGFGLTPAPYNLIFIFLGSLPLGLFYGIILGFLEGRQSTDFLVASLTASFIIGSGFAKSVGSFILLNLPVSEFLMPFVADSVILIPLSISIYFLHKVPSPNKEDIESRSLRKPMDGIDRRNFMKTYSWGMFFFVLSYVLLTTFREFRDNFAPEILADLGLTSSSTIYTKTEVPIAIFVLIIMSSMRWVKNHKLAFNIIQSLMLGGALIIGAATILFKMECISGITWLILVGLGVYIAYAMCNSLYFERMLAMFKQQGTVGFMITLADYYAYFGSLTVLFYKNFFTFNISYLAFFTNLCFGIAILYFAIVLASVIYYRKKSSMILT